MKLDILDRNTWKRADYYSHYINNLRNVISMTVEMDVTKLLAHTKENGLRFFPSFLYAVSQTVNNHEEFRMGHSPEGQPGIWDKVCPSYILFHPEDETFTRIFTPYQEDFPLFYQAVTDDLERYKSVRGFSIDNVPPNTFDVSCVPWARYRSLDIHVFDEGTYLGPVITWGKYEDDGAGRIRMPLSMQIHHAAADGFHICRFFNEVQALCDEASLWR